MSGNMSFAHISTSASKGGDQGQGQGQGQGGHHDPSGSGSASAQETQETLLTAQELRALAQGVKSLLAPHLGRGESSAAYLRRKREEFQTATEVCKQLKEEIEEGLRAGPESKAEVNELLQKYKEEKEKGAALGTRYGLVLKKELEEMELRMRIAKLQVELQSQPEEMEEKLRDADGRLDERIKEVQASCEEKTDKLRKYEDLGGLFKDLRDEFESVENAIKTKLWVKAELEKELAGSESGSNKGNTSFSPDDTYFQP